jgi:uncharacterized protein YwqG
MQMNENILKLGEECLHLVAAEKQGNSFLGGIPLVGTEIEWPRKNSKPLGFIAQFDLGEINNEKVISWLPDHGRLLFFYDLDEWPWGFDPKDKGGWSVIYENGNQELRIQNPPSDLNKEHVAPTTKYVKAVKFVSYPDAQRINYEQVGFSEDDEDEYYEFIEDQYGDEPHHQVGGFPNPIQNDSMEEDCHLVSNGIYCGDPEGYNSKEAIALNQQENDWKLLFQFDSDDDIEAMWGDLGMLYFWVREREAEKSEFSNSWMILQCS